MNIWKATWKVIKHRPWLYAAALLAWTVIRFSPLIPGLVVREILDLLSGGAVVATGPVITSGGAETNFWTLLALLVGLAVARAGLLVVGQIVWSPFYYETFGLIQMNKLDFLRHGYMPPASRHGAGFSPFYPCHSLIHPSADFKL